jgi:hypothetical protein
MLAMRRNGASHEQIAREFRCGKRTVSKLLAEAYAEAAEAQPNLAATVFEESLAQLDALIEEALAHARGLERRDHLTGDVLVDDDGKPKRWEPSQRWAETARSLIEQRAKLAGAWPTAATRVELVPQTTTTTIALTDASPMQLALLEHALGGLPRALPARKRSDGVVDAEFRELSPSVPGAVANVVPEPVSSDDKTIPAARD